MSGTATTSDESDGSSSAVGSETAEPDDTSTNTSTGAGESSSTSGSDATTGDPGTSTTSGTTDESTGDPGTSTGPGPVTLCGDGKVDPGEACDNGQETVLCDGDCTPVACGDAHVNKAAGEECDDGNVDETDGCRSNCKLPKCGDAILDDGEACDDGNAADADGCDNDCTKSVWEHAGVAYEVPADSLKGWVVCWDSQVNGPAVTFAFYSLCKQPHLLTACGLKADLATFAMVGHAPRSSVLSAVATDANGVTWKYTDNGGTGSFSFFDTDEGPGGPRVLWQFFQNAIEAATLCSAEPKIDPKWRQVIMQHP